MATADKTLTKKCRKKKQPWLMDETIELVKRKCNCKNDSEKYWELERTVCRAVKKR